MWLTWIKTGQTRGKRIKSKAIERVGKVGRLAFTVDRQDEAAFNELYQLLHLKTTDLSVPEADPAHQLPALDPNQPLVKLKQATIKYGDTVIVDSLDWTIERGQHWQLSGPNGSGETCVLSLITGDHPQCYPTIFFVFGFQRGNGESISGRSSSSSAMSPRPCNGSIVSALAAGTSSSRAFLIVSAFSH